MRENHDYESITVEQYDAREMGRQAGVRGAQERAQLDTSNGRVAVYTAGKLPWHGLGVNTDDAVSSRGWRCDEPKPGGRRALLVARW